MSDKWDILYAIFAHQAYVGMFNSCSVALKTVFVGVEGC